MMMSCSKLAILFLVSLAAAARPTSTLEDACPGSQDEIIVCAENFIKNLTHGQIALSQNCCYILMDKSLHVCWAPTHKPGTRPFSSKEEQWILDIINKYCESGKAPKAVPLYSLTPSYPPVDVSPSSSDLPGSDYAPDIEPDVEDYSSGPNDGPP